MSEYGSGYERDYGPPQGGSTSLMPLAMVGAFLIGVFVAGYVIFGEDLRIWMRVAEVSWELDDARPVTVRTDERWTLYVSGEEAARTENSLVWTIAPTGPAKLPGSEAGWTQSLLAGSRFYMRRGDEIVINTVLPIPPLSAEEEEEFERERRKRQRRHEPDPKIPPPVLIAKVGDLIMESPIPVVVTEDATSSKATFTEERIETFARKIHGREIAEGDTDPEPLLDGQADKVFLSAKSLTEGIMDYIGPAIEDLPQRRGRWWVHTQKIRIADWGEHEAKFELYLDHYEGNVAVVTAVISRVAVQGDSLRVADGLSGFKGRGEYHFDLASRRPQSGVTRIDASGKVDQAFAKLKLSLSYAVADAGTVPAIPEALGPAGDAAKLDADPDVEESEAEAWQPDVRAPLSSEEEGRGVRGGAERFPGRAPEHIEKERLDE